MGVKSNVHLDELICNEKLLTAYDTYETNINFRFNYIFRTSLSVWSPDRLFKNLENSAFDPSQNDVLPYITNARGISNITILRQELKMLKTEESLKRKEMNILVISEDGLRKNIKHLQDIISIKEEFIKESTNYSSVRSNVKDKVQRDLYKTNKKLNKIVSEFSRTSNSSSGTKNSGSEGMGSRVHRYETKMKRMTDIIQAASESQEKLYQYGNALQVSKDRLTMFNMQLNDLLKRKQDLSSLTKENIKQINQLKIKLSNFEVLTKIEKCRISTSSCLVEEDYLKKEFLELQNIRNEILSLRPEGMFNPKYQKVNSLTKEEIKRYLENDEAIDTVDYLIELKNNNFCKNGKNLLQFVGSDSNETKVFLKCLSTTNREEMKGITLHYYVKVVELKENGKESDELISKLDEIVDRQRREIGFLKNDFQNFHLSFEKKFTSLKKHYEDKLNMLFQILQEESTAITVFKLRDEITALKKKINKLEKVLIVKNRAPSLIQEQNLTKAHKSSEKLDTSKSESESLSPTIVTYHKNKMKIQKAKPK